METYSLYGLTVCSDFDLGVAAGRDGNAEITIRKERPAFPNMKGSGSGMLYHVSPDTIHLHWNLVGDFRIHGGCEISAMPAPGADGAIFLRQLTGAILSIALFQRGRMILHASAVALEAGGAIVFAGESGFGKSTLASSFHARGYHLVADDIVAIQVGDGEHQVFPGIQEFKLWPDSAEIIGQDAKNLRRFVPTEEKRLHPVKDRLQHQPVPLRLIYILDFGDSPSIEPLKPAAAAIELVRTTYGVTLLHEIRTRDYFQQLVRIARTVPVRRLRRERGLQNFGSYLAMVEKDMAEQFALLNPA